MTLLTSMSQMMVEMAKHRERDSATATVQSASVDPSILEQDESNDEEVPRHMPGLAPPSATPGLDLELPLGVDEDDSVSYPNEDEILPSFSEALTAVYQFLPEEKCPTQPLPTPRTTSLWESGSVPVRKDMPSYLIHPLSRLWWRRCRLSRDLTSVSVGLGFPRLRLSTGT